MHVYSAVDHEGKKRPSIAAILVVLSRLRWFFTLPRCDDVLARENGERCTGRLTIGQV